MKGLDLGGAPVSSKRAREYAQFALDALEEVRTMVKDMGITEFPKPNKDLPPLGTTETGNLDNRALETAYTGYVGFQAYLGPKVAEAIAAYRIAEANLKRMKANLKVGLLKEGVAKGDIDARVLDSEEYLEYDLEKLKLAAVKEILMAHFEAYQAQALALSRTIELRKLEYEQSVRQHNFANHQRRSGSAPAPDQEIRRRRAR